MDDMIKEYLLKKYGEGYEQKAQDDYTSARDRNSLANLGSNLGDAIAGNKVGSANSYFQDLNKQAKENTIGKIENDRSSYVKNTMDNANLKDLITKQEIEAAQNDPNARSSLFARSIAKKYGMPVKDTDSYKDVSQIIDPKKMMETEASSNVEFAKQKQLRMMDQSFKEKENALDREEKKGLAKKEGFAALDKDYAKDYNDWTTSGKSTLERNLQALEEAKLSLQKDPSLTGGLTGVLGDRMTADRVLEQRQKVNSAIQGGLRATLGTAFTEQEGVRVLKNAYNEAASAKTNIKSLDAAINDLRKKGIANEEKARFFEKSGSSFALLKAPDPFGPRRFHSRQWTTQHAGTVQEAPRQSCASSRWGSRERAIQMAPL
jgi:hypothetical protein